MYLVTSDQMQACDHYVIHETKVPGIVLMDHAGKAVADVVRELQPKRVVVCAGKGNNGGDGWITARWCVHYGIETIVVSAVNPEVFVGNARCAFESAVKSGVSWELFDAGSTLRDADVYVDALLGTGASRPPVGEMLTFIQAMNAKGKPIVAVDVPSGVHPSTGEVPSEAVRAAKTVCFAAQKLGTAVSPGCYFSGEVYVRDIGISVPSPAEFAGSSQNLASWITDEQVRASLPKRLPESHKGTYGRLGLTVGDMQGAATLAGRSALRMGAGLVILCSEDRLSLSDPEFVLRTLSDSGMLSDSDALSDCDALVFGPGLGKRASRYGSLIRNWTKPIVVDADGLQQVPLLESDIQARGGQLACAVLTPHPKECARMLGWSTLEVQARRLEAAKTLATRTSSIVVLKGFRTIVAHPDGRIRVNGTGDASLATAGTGDVLAGMVGALLAQGVPPFDAACSAVWLHGRAGELAGQDIGMTSVIASDVVETISRAIRALST